MEPLEQVASDFRKQPVETFKKKIENILGDVHNSDMVDCIRSYSASQVQRSASAGRLLKDLEQNVKTIIQTFDQTEQKVGQREFVKFQTVNGKSILKTKLFDLSNYAGKRAASVQLTKRDRDAPAVDVDDDWSKLSGKSLYDSCLRSSSVMASRKSMKDTVDKRSDLLLSCANTS